MLHHLKSPPPLFFEYPYYTLDTSTITYQKYIETRNPARLIIFWKWWKAARKLIASLILLVVLKNCISVTCWRVCVKILCLSTSMEVTSLLQRFWISISSCVSPWFSFWRSLVNSLVVGQHVCSCFATRIRYYTPVKAVQFHVVDMQCFPKCCGDS